MLKVYINEEEVVANQNFTIQKHMLNTPSVILNNLCPKTWCENRDYSSFYHPLDYSKCKIQDETYYPDLPGTIVSSTNASLTITDADTTKLCELTQLDGNTTQEGTPTPTTPQPVNVVSGRQDIVVAGKNLFSLENIVNNGAGRTTYEIQDDNIVITATSSGTYRYIYKQIDNLTIGQEYTIKIGSHNDTSTNKIAQWGVVNSQGNYYVYVRNLKDYQQLTFTPTETSATFRAGYLGNSCNANDILTIGQIQLEKGNQATSYEAYKGTTYEINLGKNLFDINATYTRYNTVVSISNNTLTQTNSGTYARSMWEINNLVVGKDYTIRYNYINANSSSLQVRIMDSTNTNVLRYGNTITATSGTDGLTFTATETTHYIRLYSNTTNTSNTAVVVFYNIQLEKGSIATTYAPYKTPIELCKIGNYQDFIKKGTGKNLFDKDTTNILNAYISGSQQKIIARDNSRTLYIPCKSNTTYTISKIKSSVFIVISATNYVIDTVATNIQNNASATSLTITTGADDKYLCVYYYLSTSDTLTKQEILDSIQIEEGTQATPYEPYGMYNKWYIEKQIGKVVLDGSETMSVAKTGTANWYYDITKPTGINVDSTPSQNNAMCDYYPIAAVGNSNTNQGIYVVKNSGKIRIRYGAEDTTTNFKNWLSTHNTSVYYVLATPTYTEITDSELIEQLNALRLLEGLNNISITSGDLPGEITIHYNYQFEHTDIDLLFCGVVKNSGKISLNPREPHYSSLQILDFKTFLSEGETLDYVIYQKTILEAIQQVIGTISEYGFVLGNVNILNPDDIIGAYSTKDKTAYDVFNYIADITQSRWTTRMINENQVAIDFYDPTLMPEGTEIDYTDTFFNNNLIDDIKYSYGTNNYRNKQVMTSNQVYSNISQTQTIVANGYQTQFSVEQPIGKIKSITSNNIPLTFATYSEKEMGYVADFYYTPGENYFDSKDLRTTGEVLVIEYVAIIEGRQVITNSTEIERINESTGRKGIVARYENRNDATTSLELQKIGESYIKYKGTPEIILTIQNRKNTWEVGQRVRFNAPIDELDTEYMVRSKKINYITSNETLFYTYELVSSFNSETEINYFDNQRAKATGNIGEGEYISRNIDIESTANIIFYDTTTTETTLDGDNELNAILNSPIVS